MISPFVYVGLPLQKQYFYSNRIPDIKGDLNSVVAHVSEKTGVSIPLILGKKRDLDIVLARKISIYLACKLNVYTLKEIGKFFNNMHHSSIIYCRDSIYDLKKIKDKKVLSILKDIER